MDQLKKTLELSLIKILNLTEMNYLLQQKLVTICGLDHMATGALENT